MTKEHKILVGVVIVGSFLGALAAMSVHQYYIAHHIKAAKPAPKA